MVGFKASVQRTGFRSTWRALEGAVAKAGREFRSTRKRANADAPRLLNCPVLDPPTGGWSNQCPYGAEPRLHGCFCKAHDHSSSDI